MKKSVLIILVLFIITSNASNFDRVWFGMNLEGGLAGTGTMGSSMFDKNYAHYDSAGYFFGGALIGGLTLNIQITETMGIATGLNYRFAYMPSYIYTKKDSIEITLKDHTVNIPALLRLKFESNGPNSDANTNFILECGVQKGVHFNSNAKIYNKQLGINDTYYSSDFRVKNSLEVVLGFGTETNGFSIIGGVIISTTKLDTYGGIPGPIIMKIGIGFPLFGF